MTTLYHGNNEDWTTYTKKNLHPVLRSFDNHNHIFLSNNRRVALSYVDKDFTEVSYRSLTDEQKKVVDEIELPKGFKFFQAINKVIPNILYYEITPEGELTGKALLPDNDDPAKCRGNLVDIDPEVLEVVRKKQASPKTRQMCWQKYSIIYGDGKYYNGFENELVIPYGVWVIAARGELMNEAKNTYYNDMCSFKKGSVMKTVEVELENPYVMDYKGRYINTDEVGEIIEQAMKSGHDGAIFHNIVSLNKVFCDRDEDLYVVFNPSDVRVMNTEVLA